MTAEDLMADGCCSVKEAAAFLSIGQTMLYAEMEQGRLAYVKIGRRRVIPRRALVRLAAQSVRGGWKTAEPPTVARNNVLCGTP